MAVSIRVKIGVEALDIVSTRIAMAIMRKQTELALKNSEDRYRSITYDVMDSSKVGIFILDKNFNVAWINKSIELYFGLKREDVIGKDKRALIKTRIRSIFENGEWFKEKVYKTYDDNTYTENFICHVLSDEEREDRWMEHWSQPIRSGLYSGGRVEHYTDITETKANRITNQNFPQRKRGST